MAITSNPTYIAKLHRTGFSKFRNGKVSCLRLNEQLAKGHLLAPEHRPHLGNDLFLTLRREIIFPINCSLCSKYGGK